MCFDPTPERRNSRTRALSQLGTGVQTPLLDTIDLSLQVRSSGLVFVASQVTDFLSWLFLFLKKHSLVGRKEKALDICRLNEKFIENIKKVTSFSLILKKE